MRARAVDSNHRQQASRVTSKGLANSLPTLHSRLAAFPPVRRAPCSAPWKGLAGWQVEVESRRTRSPSPRTDGTVNALPPSEASSASPKGLSGSAGVEKEKDDARRRRWCHLPVSWMLPCRLLLFLLTVEQCPARLLGAGVRSLSFAARTDGDADSHQLRRDWFCPFLASVFD